jgi:hypothetical protein
MADDVGDGVVLPVPGGPATTPSVLSSIRMMRTCSSLKAVGTAVPCRPSSEPLTIRAAEIGQLIGDVFRGQ